MKKILPILLLALLLLSLFLPVKFPFRFETKARIYPFQRWVVEKLPNGNLATQWQTYLDGNTFEASTFQFERGDIIQSRFVASNKEVSAGDTLVSIHSLNLAVRLTRLSEQLSVARAALLVRSTGKRRVRIVQAQQQLAFAEQQLERATQKYDRNKPLFENEVIPNNEFEQITNNYALAKIQVEIAHSNLLAAKTGKKPEEIALAQARIKALEAELEVLEQKQAAYQITAPFGGMLMSSDSLVEVLALEDRSKLVLVAAVPMHIVELLGDTARIELQDLLSAPLALSRFSHVYMLEQQQVYLIRMELPAHEDLLPGQWLSCQLKGKSMGVWGYLTYLLSAGNEGMRK